MPATPQDAARVRVLLARVLPNLLIGCLVAAAGLSLCFWILNADRRALQTLPPGQRQHLYQMTHDSLVSLCVTDPPLALIAHCRDQARLLLGFPECGPDCQQLAGHLIQSRK